MQDANRDWRLAGAGIGAVVGGSGDRIMPIHLETTIEAYLKAKNLSQGTRDEYRATLRKWKQWRTDTTLVEIDRKTVRDFLDWVYEHAIEEEGTNPGRTANKARENLRAVMSWAWEQDLIESLPRFPRPRPQRVVAGRHYLTKAELNALYFATFQMKRPRGWDAPFTIGHYWRCALVLFFNYGMDTGTLWGTLDCHEPLLWRHVSWDRVSLDGQRKERCRWGWLFYKRVKTGKSFHRPVNRIVHAHLKSILPEEPDPNMPVVLGGGTRPNIRFQQLCELAGIGPKTDVETGEQKLWVLKDLRKTCATYYDAHVPESSIEILGHSMGGVTYRHYAHRDPLAFKAIMTIPQPAAFKALARGIDGRCPCCRRPF